MNLGGSLAVDVVVVMDDGTQPRQAPHLWLPIRIRRRAPCISGVPGKAEAMCAQPWP